MTRAAALCVVGVVIGCDSGPGDAGPTSPFLTAAKTDGVAVVSTSGRSVVGDGRGNTYVAGTFSGTIDVGDKRLVAKSTRDFFVLRLDGAGTPRWLVGAEGAKSDSATALAWGPGGRLYLTGTFAGNGRFGKQALFAKGPSDIVVARISDTGDFEWAKQFGGRPATAQASDYDAGTGIAADGASGLFICGSFNGPAEFGAKRATAKGTNDIFVARLDERGDVAWVATGAGQVGGSARVAAATGVAVQAGRVVVAGWFEGSATFGSTALTGAGRADLFAAGIDGASGKVSWALSGGGAGADAAYAVTGGVGKGGFVVAGTFNQGGAAGATGRFGGKTVKGLGASDIVYARIDDGRFSWVRLGGGGTPGVSGTQLESGFGLASTGDGRFLLTGRFLGDGNLGAQKLSGYARAGRPFVALVDDKGAPTWSATGFLPKVGLDHGYGEAVASDGRGGLVVAGGFRGDLELDGREVKSGTSPGIFVWRRALP